MYEKGFTWGEFNPLHYGHIALLKTGLMKIEGIDVYVGKKSLSFRLPYEVRVECLEQAIKFYGFQDRVNLLDSSYQFNTINHEEYDVLLAGSDLLNHFSPSDETFKSKDIDFITSFSKLLMLDRVGGELKDDAKQVIKSFTQLEEYEGVSPVSSNAIRRKYCNGEDISKMVPTFVIELILKHAEIFYNE